METIPPIIPQLLGCKFDVNFYREQGEQQIS